jgi:hypothetical protein
MRTRIQNAYGVGGPTIPVFPLPIIAERAPVNGTDVNFPQGQTWWDNSVTPRVEYVYNGDGTWAVADTPVGAVSSVTGTANQILATPTSGNVVLSLIGPYTPATYTAHGILLGQGTSSITALGVGATGTLLSGVTGADPAFTASPSVTGSITAGTTVTATLGNVTATNGNFVGSTAGTGLLFNANSASGVASGPVVLNSRAGRVTFTSVSIAAAADLTLTMTNSAITSSATQVICSMSGATTGSALSIKSKTAGSGTIAIVVTNGTGASTTTADIEIEFLVVN